MDLRTLALIQRENERQFSKWGEQNHVPEKWLLILMEEVGEFSKEYLEKNFMAARRELVQVAAVAAAMLESWLRGMDEHTK